MAVSNAVEHIAARRGAKRISLILAVPKGQIICSCPITKSTAANAQSYHILGPYPCDKSFFKYCKGATANSKTGSTIYVGAPVGTAAALAVQLNGKVPPLNECSPPGAN